MAGLPQNLAVAVQRVLKTPGPAEVHDLRVAIRRFNQAAALNSQNRNKKARAQVKEIMKCAGDVRNLDITLKLVGKLKATKGLQSKLHHRRKAAAEVLVDRLKTCSVPPQLPAQKRPQPRQPAIRAIQRLFKRSVKARRPRDLHRVRIAAKKLRYTLEMVAPTHPRIAEIKRLQSELGRINDYETAWKLVKAAEGPNAVREQLKDKQRKKIRAFRSSWDGILADGGVERTWIRELSP